MAAALFDDRLTGKPPVGAGLVKPIIAKAGLPPVTMFGKKPKLESAAGPGGARRVTVADFDELLNEAVMVTGVSAVTAVVVETKVPLCAPAGMVMLPGTANSAGLLLASATTAPGPCAPPVRDTVVENELPPEMDEPDGDSRATVAGGGGAAVPLRANLVIKASPQKIS